MINHQRFNRIEKNNRLISICIAVLFLLLFFNVFALTSIQPFIELARTADNITLYFTFFVFTYLLFYNNFYLEQEYFNIYIGFSLISIIYIGGHIYNRNFEENSLLTTILLTFIYIIAMMKIRWTNNHILLFGYIANLIVILFYLHWGYLGFLDNRFMSVFNNSNVFGMFLFSLLYFQIVNIRIAPSWAKIYFAIGVALSLILIYVSTTRTVMLALGIIVISWLIIKFSKKFFATLLYWVIGGNFAILLLYVYVAKSKYAPLIDQWVREHTNKRFFSGRENIWGDVINFGLEAPFLGHKVGISINEYMDSPYNHTHNQYLQIFVESGFLGLASFLLILFFIWKYYMNHLDLHLVQWSACFFLGILVFENFELSLFITHPSIGFIQWFIIAIGVSKSINQT
ncbi:O-antigen ligase family protein [Robertmurraya massiliosenegalensis]|uniref:O-antigen ligase family protein n=1 Tax=Robertmurraya TaxID=2837507 RepID=UPI0039A62A47